MKQKEIVVLYIITKLELGGAQKVCLSLLNGLKNEGHKAGLISGNQGPLVPQIKGKSMVFLLPSMQREVSLQQIIKEGKNFFALIRLIKKLKKEHPTLTIHTHSTKAGLLGRWAAFFAGVKKRVHTVHGYGFHPHQTKVGWLINYACELITSLITTHYICVSSKDVKTGIQLLPRFGNKHSIIRAAVDWQTFHINPKKLKKSRDRFTFGTIACFKKQKNLFDALQAFEQVAKQENNAYFEIVGDGHLRKKIESWIEKHKLTNRIILHGWQENITPFTQQWNAFILSSLWEGLPCAVIEARLQKLPVLSYDTGGIHDVIFNGNNGFLYKPKDWKNLSKGMLRLIRNKDLHAKLSIFDDDLSSFSTQTMIKQHINLYKSL